LIPIRVKICGIRNLEEARLAVNSGADAVGCLCGLRYRTGDEVEQQDAQRIISLMPSFISTVLVTHRTDLEEVARTCKQVGCSTVQLHGEFALERIPQLRDRIPNVKIIKAVHVRDETAVRRAQEAALHADAILLDSQTSTRIGGTGQTHDWGISARIVNAVAKPVILAGGLKPENVRQAIETVHPFAVDVNSGVEAADGAKSPERVREFIRLAKSGGAA
jgi:phosphoribosylanthranilate isomerase